MFVCVCVFVSVLECVCAVANQGPACCGWNVCVCVLECMCVSTQECMCVCVNVSTLEYVCVCVYVNVNALECVCVCERTRICACVLVQAKGQRAVAAAKERQEVAARQAGGLGPAEDPAVVAEREAKKREDREMARLALKVPRAFSVLKSLGKLTSETQS